MIKVIELIYKLVLGEYKYALKCGLKAGKNVTIMRGVRFGSEPYLITLGNNVRLSSDIRFITHDGGTWAFRREEGKKKIVRFGKISIGDDTFVGMRTIILPGVNVGKNCIIGAGSVVTKDVPDRSVVAGVPARIISTTDEYAIKIEKNMPKNFDYDEYCKDKKGHLTKIL